MTKGAHERTRLERLRDIAQALEAKSARERQAPAPNADGAPRGLDEVFEEVRLDVTSRRAGFRESVGEPLDAPRLGVEPVSALHALPNAEPIAVRDEYHLAELMRYDGEEFVRNAYRAVLHREPDEPGMKHFLSELYSGRVAKVELIELLSASQEGRRNPVRVHGLARAARMRRWRRIPVLGALIAILQHIVGLPHVVRALERHDIMATRQEAYLRTTVAGMNHLAARTAACVDELGVLVNQLNRQKASRAVAASLAERMQRMGEELSEASKRAEWRTTQVLLARFTRDVAAELTSLHKSLGEMGAIDADVTGLDAFYTAFEDRFRGSRDVIRDRLGVYLPVIRDAGAGTDQASVVDLGCGRCEWLELLKDEGLEARGVDTNGAMIALAAQLGVEAEQGDALEFLEETAPDSLGAVTAMHVVEHLSFRQQVRLIDLALRALRPGGVLVLETPNPENLTVGAFTFWNDPTHSRPIPPETLQAMAELRGFGRAEILRLHPYPSAAHLPEPGTPVRDVMNHLLYGPQDYAILAYKT
jgi:O-antigen chain-terminating methyltransferase